MSDLIQQIKELFRMPQSLCRQCGQCCHLGVFKGGLTYEQILELIENPETPFSQTQGAKAFLSVFQPVSYERAKEINGDFIDYILEAKNKTSDEMTFFSCQFVTDDHLCLIHEDRPELCRMHPIPHPDSHYFQNCGFYEQGQENYKKIKEITDQLGINF